MATTYDTVWDMFVLSSGLPVEVLPHEERYIKPIIQEAIDYYNEVTDADMNGFLDADDNTELITPNLNRRQVRLLSECVHLKVLEMLLEDFEVEWQFKQKEVESKFYNQQVAARQENIKSIEEHIDQVVSNMRSNEWFA